MSGRDRIAFVGDVHLDHGDTALAEFLGFLDRLGARAERIVLMGDLFNLWIGRAETEGAHHRAVTDKLAALRRTGVVVRYLEGNRDYRVGGLHGGGALDDVADGGLVEAYGGHSIFAIHGDLANPADRQYRVWRRLSRSAPFWALYRMIPPGARGRLAERLESRFRTTNLEFKGGVPEEQVLAYARGYMHAGHDVVVLGHFHEERQWEIREPRGRVLILPEWKGSRRHLEVLRSGEVRFVDS